MFQDLELVLSVNIHYNHPLCITSIICSAATKSMKHWSEQSLLQDLYVSITNLRRRWCCQLSSDQSRVQGQGGSHHRVLVIVHCHVDVSLVILALLGNWNLPSDVGTWKFASYVSVSLHWYWSMIPTLALLFCIVSGLTSSCAVKTGWFNTAEKKTISKVNVDGGMLYYIIFLMMVGTASGHNLRGLSAIASSKVFGPEVSPKETLLPWVNRCPREACRDEMLRCCRWWHCGHWNSMSNVAPHFWIWQLM